MTEPTIQIGLNELCLLIQNDQCLREECLYLKEFGISCRKFEKVYPKWFLTNFQFLEEFQYRSSELCLIERVTNMLERNIFTWNNLVLAEKVPMSAPQPFLTIFQFLQEIYCRSNLHFLWPNLKFKLAQIICVFSKGWPIS